jgi:hypothetical protein
MAVTPQRSCALAATTGEWLCIAEALFDACATESELRDALGYAETLAKDSELASRVATAYRHYLGDYTATERLGEIGQRPEQLRVRVSPLANWDSSASALFDGLRKQVTLQNLTCIANADYGMDASKHLAALRDICESGKVPRVLAWQPHEVLALTRWSDGQNVNHLERALACTLLCMAPSDTDELVTTGPLLLESCLALGTETTGHAQQFFAWLAESVADECDEDEMPPERPVALLLLYLAYRARAPEDPRIGAMSAMLLALPDGGIAELKVQCAGSLQPKLWAHLFETLLGPAQSSDPYAGQLLAALEREH